MKLSSLRKLTKKQRIIALFFIAGFFSAMCLFIIGMNFRGITVNAPDTEKKSEPAEVVYRDPFTGKPLTEAAPGSRVACVMIENSADAWPLSGVEDAFFVIEAPAEGGIPRFVACFTEEGEVAKIGPVRSARPYFIAWASGFRGALYAHVGGSPQALELLEVTSNVVDLNEFWNGSSFWRDNARYAPHNAYTSSAMLWNAADWLEVFDSISPGWAYGESKYTSLQTCENIFIPWGSASSYDVLWDCDEATGTYVRKQGGSSTTSSDGDVYRAENVVILEADISIIDEVGRRRITTEGTGNAHVCSEGICKNATWQKKSPEAPLQFFIQGTQDPMVFVPGKTWIEVVEDLGSVQVGDQIE